MTPLRRFALAITPFFILGACSELIGLSDFEKGDAPEGEGGEESTGGKGATSGKGGTSGSQNGGSSGTGRGGTGTSGKGGQGGTGNTGPGGESGDTGMGGEPPEGGTGGMTGGRGGAAGASGGGMAGGGGKGDGGAGTAGGGVGGVGGAGGAGGGMGGAGSGMGGAGGGSCTTVTVPLRSPGFDSDTGAWVQYDDGMGPPTPPIILSGTSAGITAHSVPNVANLGGRDDIYYEGHYQTVTIPAGAVTLTLSGYRQVITEETGSTIYDRARLQMYEDALNATGFMGEFAVFTNVDANSGWAFFTGSLAVGARAGQMVDLDMWAISDSTLITDLFVDSLTLTAFVCP